MSAFGPADNETPRSLLNETVVFTRQLLDVLADADIKTSRFCPFVSELSFYCLKAEVSEHIVSLYQPYTTVLRQPAFAASHPAVLETYRAVVEQLLTAAGFTTGSDRDKPAAFNDGDFTLASTRGVTELTSFSISILASPTDIRRALRVDDRALTALCLSTLEKTFDDMAAFCAGVKTDVQKTCPTITPPKGFRNAPRFSAN